MVEKDKMKLIETIKAHFESGLRPKEIAEKVGENAYRISALGRLLGYSFSATFRDPFEWFTPTDSKYMRIGASGTALGISAKRYRCIELNKTKKTVTFEWA